ncbi:DNA-directed RNA polymerase [Theileria orientalis]|uniref:DNA-directed RNA polymerase n=1 Tax=Theileria orientalis TaxID=68886 RepID=A0A976MEM1_THEOR|nr:DNA-directed RNA polymerase [Theileria orientalis]
MDDEEGRLFRCRRTCCEMLEDRGYFIPGKERLETFAEFKARYELYDRMRSKMLLVASQKTASDNKLLVYFADETRKTGVKPIRELTERMEDHDIHRAILVTRNVLTPFAKDAIMEAYPRNIIENFMETELLVNITRHELVPKHIPLTMDEKQNLLQKYKVKESQIPRIQSADPVARYFGLSKGQVVKIIRPSETAGRYVTFRLVV